MGNRGSYATPGMQWISAGSGIEHAEAGGTPAGLNTTGFQLWLNVPSDKKMEPPRYGTEPPENLPLLDVAPGVTARLLGGSISDARGPFKSIQPIQLVHFEMGGGASLCHALPAALDNACVYAFNGSATLDGGKVELRKHDVAKLDASDANARVLAITAGPDGASIMLFAGKRLDQPIAWRGPFVMTTQAEIADTVRAYQMGAFPPVRAAWDYRSLAAFPADHPARVEAKKA